MQINTSSEFEKVFINYPDLVRNNMLFLRELIEETANEMHEITQLEETLKWGEPGFLTKNGSTIRIDWKPKTPQSYAMYFQCTSRLVETFKIIFKNTFQFEGKRAIVFQLNDKVPVAELKFCIKAALTYHKVKHLPTLGI
ncbi:DUF1801 domain-containing protein [Maribellus sediminis]|uniref:DUF1801 domain-containing protein n=1 Tax=Maribellus sediminis TaxID=2696285 RepID=UPI0014320A03|nr:DUF1801 domain-containing protein [Maribellus sediminis]